MMAIIEVNIKKILDENNDDIERGWKVEELFQRLDGERSFNFIEQSPINLFNNIMSRQQAENLLKHWYLTLDKRVEIIDGELTEELEQIFPSIIKID